MCPEFERSSKILSSRHYSAALWLHYPASLDDLGLKQLLPLFFYLMCVYKVTNRFVSIFFSVKINTEHIILFYAI